MVAARPISLRITFLRFPAAGSPGSGKGLLLIGLLVWAGKEMRDRLTPRDLVTHRSGLPRHDAVWYNANVTRDELYQRLRFLEPSKDLRALFQYNNLMFFTAGYLTERLTGMKWEDAVRMNLLQPLGMTATNFSVNDMARTSDYAMPYEKDDKGEVQDSTLRNLDTMGPAGSINSNAEEMANYILLHLARGKFGGKQVLSESDVLEMQSPQMVTPTPVTHPEV